jgi:hypothetical protein
LAKNETVTHNLDQSTGTNSLPHTRILYFSSFTFGGNNSVHVKTRKSIRNNNLIRTIIFYFYLGNTPRRRLIPTTSKSEKKKGRKEGRKEEEGRRRGDEIFIFY